ncbi:hypothetical protein Q73_12680 [Bacillus coahuilensis m2-6]|uniref:methyl-accepting chemotaxis protein n=1 Tax=Bacillus coahuilensis TaxID=408580 RepID=UPI0007505E8F|nr:methyl-accepting chemotaxis protein [Bacillus coahuilensis]KUP05676.1 hypothetical protein Q73_12680 [Bacillus coahuilensis m2-6]
MEQSKKANNVRKLFKYVGKTLLQGLLSGAVIIFIFSLLTDRSFFSIPHLALLVGIGLSFSLFGLVNFLAYANPFDEIQYYVERISQGDLSTSINQKKLGPLATFGEPLENMRMGLVKLVTHLQRTGHQVAQVTNEVTEQLYSSEDVIQTTEESISKFSHAIESLATGTRESATTMEEMTQGVQRIAETSVVATESSQSAADLATDGQGKIQSLTEQMNSIHDSFEDLAKTIRLFAEESNRIGEIVEAITNIAGQTNLLSLNASIEAARAGEAGKGFAVVAEEVRKLSEETNQSASQITSLIKGIQDKSQSALSAMVQTNQDVDKGISGAKETELAFKKILESIDLVNSQIQEISAVSEEMAAGSEEVAASIEEMASHGESSKSSIHELLDGTSMQAEVFAKVQNTSDVLKQSSEELSKVINVFKLS